VIQIGQLDNKYVFINVTFFHEKTAKYLLVFSYQGLTQVEQLLAESNKIQTKGTAPLVNALKARLGDTNKTLAQMALNILGDFSTASGPAAAEHMKVIIPAIFNCFTDSKVTVRCYCLPTFYETSNLTNLFACQRLKLQPLRALTSG